MSKYGVYLCTFFPAFRLNIGKYEPEKTPYLDTFRAVLRNHYTYFIRTIPGMEDQLEPLQNSIRHKLIPRLLEGHQYNNEERKLPALLTKLRWFGSISTADIAKREYMNSKR